MSCEPFANHHCGAGESRGRKFIFCASASHSHSELNFSRYKDVKTSYGGFWKNLKTSHKFASFLITIIFDKLLHQNQSENICFIIGYLTKIKFLVVSIIFRKQNTLVTSDNLAGYFAGRKMVQQLRSKVLELILSRTAILHSLNDGNVFTDNYVWGRYGGGENFVFSTESYCNDTRGLNNGEVKSLVESAKLLGANQQGEFEKKPIKNFLHKTELDSRSYDSVLDSTGWVSNNVSVDFTNKNTDHSNDTNLSDSEPVEQSRSNNLQNRNVPIGTIPPNIENTTTDNQATYDVTQPFNPFDFRTTRWNDGSSVIKASKMIPETDFPKKETLVEGHTDHKFSIISQNVPLHQCLSNTDVFFKITENFPNTDIIGLCELYIERDIKIECPKGYFLMENGDSTIISSAFLIKNHIKKYVSLSPCFLNNTVIKLRLGRKRGDYVFLTNIYRSPGPGSKFLNSIGLNQQEYSSALFSFFSKNFKKSIIMGDLNYDVDNTVIRGFRNGEERRLTEKIKGSPLIGQIEGIMTHQCKNSNNFSKTDILLVSCDTVIFDIDVPTDQMIRKFDHLPICFSVKHFLRKVPRKEISTRGKFFEKIPFAKKNSEKTEMFKNLKTVGLEKADFFRELIDNWERTDEGRSSCRESYNEIMGVVDKIMPLRKVLTKTGDSKFCLSIKYHNFKRDLRKIYNKGGPGAIRSHNYRDLVKKIRKERQKCIRRAKMSEASERLRAQKGGWAIFQVFEGDRPMISEALDCNDFSKHFQQLSFDYEEKSFPCPTSDYDAYLRKFASNKNSYFELELPLILNSKKPHLDIMYWLNNSKGSVHAKSLDGASPALLRHLNKEGLEALNKLVSTILFNGDYLREFRILRGMPIFKKGDPDSVLNYRPILISNAVASITEAIFGAQMIKSATEKGHLHKNQFGFLKDRSIGECVNKARRFHLSKPKNWISNITLTDLSNAFGSSEVDLIVDKMQDNMGPKALRLLRGFLNQSNVTIDAHGKMSHPFTTSYRGYPQGSRLSPLLFVLLMSKSHDSIYGDSTWSFADDCTLSTVEKSWDTFRQKSQGALNTFVDFCDNFSLKLNPSKTVHCPIIRSNANANANYDLFIKGEKIRSESSLNILGVRLCNALRFGPHVNNFLNKIKSRCGMVRRYLKICSNSFTRVLILSLLFGSASHCIQYVPTLNLGVSKKFSSMINSTLRLKFTNKVEKEIERKFFEKIPQYLVMNRSDMMSIENIIRVQKLTKLNNVLTRGLPAEEFLMIIETLEGVGNNRIRDREIIPRLSARPRVDRNKPPDYFSTQPYDWLVLLEKIPLGLKSNLGTIKFANKCQEFFSALCQHSEYGQTICQNCNQIQTAYSTEGFKNISKYRYPDVSILNDKMLITREMILGLDFTKSHFLQYTASKTNWWDNNIEMSHASFLLTPPEAE